MTMDGQDVTQMVGERTDLRWEFQTIRDERLFQVRALRYRGEVLRAARAAYAPGWRERRNTDSVVGMPPDYYSVEAGRRRLEAIK